MQAPAKMILSPFHIRVKRKTDTFFVRVEEPATVETLRKTAALMMAVPPKQLRLCRIAEDGRAIRYLEDDTHIADLGLRNDHVVCAVLHGEHGWETPCIVDFPNV